VHALLGIQKFKNEIIKRRRTVAKMQLHFVQRKFYTTVCYINHFFHCV